MLGIGWQTASRGSTSYGVVTTFKRFKEGIVTGKHQQGLHPNRVVLIRTPFPHYA